MSRALVPILLAAIVWRSYWFWGAQNNLESITKGLERPAGGSTEIKYGLVSQVGFPNRYDVTVNNLSIENPIGEKIVTLPFIQVLRLIYKSNHKIIIFPNSLSIYDFNIKWENAKASIVEDTLEDRIILEAHNLIVSEGKRLGFKAERLQVSMLYEKFGTIKPAIIINFAGIETENKQTKFKLHFRANLNLKISPALDLSNFVNTIMEPNTWVEFSEENYKTSKSFLLGNQKFLLSNSSYKLFK